MGLITSVNGVQQPETYYEAGPVDKTTGQLTGSFANAWLNSLDPPPSTTHTYNNTSALVWQTGFSSDECATNDAVKANAASYPQSSITYGGAFGLNSNSFTYSLLAMSGVSIPSLVNYALGGLPGPISILPLPLAPGWGTLIPW